MITARLIKFIPLLLIIVAISHFVIRSRSGQIAGAKNQAIDWETIDPMVSLLPREVYTAKPGLTDPETIVKAKNTELYPEDRVKFFPDPDLGLGAMLSLQRALPVEIQDGNEQKLVRTWQKTVGGLLDEEATEIGEKDQLRPGKESALTPGISIVIVHVTETEVKELEPIPFTTKTKNDPELEKGVTKIEQKGQKGKRARYYLVRRENGKTVEKKFLRQEIVEEPIDELIILGTKVTVLGEGRATWFSAPAMTAAHNSLPRGTRVRVVNKKNGHSVVVKIIGGGIQRDNVIIDLSPDAFKQLAPLGEGVIPVRLEKE